MMVQSNSGNDDYVALDKLKEELYLKLAMTNRKIKLFFFPRISKCHVLHKTLFEALQNLLLK